MVSSINCSFISKLEEQSIQFDLNELDQNELDKQIVKLSALKNGQNFRITNTNQDYQFQNGDVVCASIEYQKKLNQTGWDIIYLETDKGCSQEEQMECAGFLEGLATKQAISDFLFNISESRKSTNKQYDNFFTNAYNNLLINANNPPNQKSNKYWKTAKLFLHQLIGMKNGFNSIEKNEKQKLDLWKISLPNIDGQADEIDTLISSSHSMNMNSQANLIHQKMKFKKTIQHKRTNPLKKWEKMMQKSRCSVFFKVLTSEKNGEAILNDVFATHSTWESYSSMNRIYKFYNLPNIDNQHEWIQMSSYPGAISSTDDFIIKQDKFLTTETSIATIRENIIPSYNADELDLPDFIRVQTATSLSSTAKEWAQYMQTYGQVKMYSSEWMVLDIQKLQKGQSVQKETLMFLSSSYEKQILKDITDQFIKETYFASFNNPQLEEIREYLGYTDMEEENKYLEYQNDPRNQIFKYFQSKTTSLETVKWLIQHNSFQKDKIKGEPTFDSPFAAIGARGDLGEENVNYGAVDSKVVDLENLKNFSVEAISGPSHQEQPIFVWKGNERHQGQPTKWDFGWNNISLDDKSD